MLAVTHSGDHQLVGSLLAYSSNSAGESVKATVPNNSQEFGLASFQLQSWGRLAETDHCKHL